MQHRFVASTSKHYSLDNHIDILAIRCDCSIVEAPAYFLYSIYLCIICTSFCYNVINRDNNVYNIVYYKYAFFVVCACV